MTDITHLLSLVQCDAAKELNMTCSTFSKKWMSSVGPNRKWPHRALRQLDARIQLLRASPDGLDSDEERHLLGKRLDLLSPVTIDAVTSGRQKRRRPDPLTDPAITAITALATNPPLPDAPDPAIPPTTPPHDDPPNPAFPPTAPPLLPEQETRIGMVSKQVDDAKRFIRLLEEKANSIQPVTTEGGLSRDDLADIRVISAHVESLRQFTHRASMLEYQVKKTSELGALLLNSK